ncbi:intradiol ring-cleavage dioxygenase [Streptomyces sp. NPDC053367]|uniref:intradiol ring-cleavage dioxygenase n=1 Tax=Streptomyces sp. NPDC053367 TaxID=3365700 RepID=UPI0037CF4151
MTGTPAHKKSLTRRNVLVAGAGAVAAAGVGGTLAAGAFADEDKSTPSAESCYRLTSETTEGPYYIDADKLRQDITEDKDGVPLVLRLRVIDAETCRPLRDAAVDIWHCDALGIYSGYESLSTGGGGGGGGGTPPTGMPSGAPTDLPSGAPTGEPPSGAPSGGPGGGTGGGIHEEPTDDERYLRGTWRTDSSGHVTFRTIFPGWYRGRCVHIHTKVHVGGKWTEAGYEGGTTCHTGQFFFAEEAVLAVAEVAPYSTSTTERTTLTEDTIYDGSGTAGGLLKLTYGRKNIAKGVVGSITVGVDPGATHTGT